MDISMNRNRILQSLVAGAVILGWAPSASATHPLITVESACEAESGFVIIYTATSWNNDGSDPGGGNPQIDILFDGTVVDSGSFESPDWSFSNTLPAPAGAGPGDSVAVAALAVGTWTDGSTGGQSDSTTVTLPAEPCDPINGRFTGGGRQIKLPGCRVTRGLTIHCDLLLSNNLEINWNGGNKFHMTEHLTTVQCSDDPTIIQFPPAAPLDTLIGVGTGRVNNQDGFTVEFVLVDGGEPGRMVDEMGIKIYETANPGNVVLDVVKQHLERGNLQAHFDQPHK